MSDAKKLIEKWKNKKGCRGWFHRIHLGDGIYTPGTQDCQHTLDRIKLPKDLTGANVLDIGFNDGFFSIECEHRGAIVDGIDLFPDIGLDVAEYMNSTVNLAKGDLFTFKPKKKYDVVLCMGVIYHVKDIIGAFEKLYKLCNGLLILETHIATGLDAIKNPIARLYPGAELNNDDTNWWGCNQEMVLALLKCVGFKNIKVISVWNDRLSVHATK